MRITVGGASALAVMLPLTMFAADPATDMFKAYADMNYSKAMSLAVGIQETPMTKLVKGLCLLHDPRQQDFAKGFNVLRELYGNESNPDNIRQEAALSYGRMAWLLQCRGDLYKGKYDGYDAIGAFKWLVGKYPSSEAAIDAMIYMSEDCFGSKSQEVQDNGFEYFENFIHAYNGPQERMVPLHLLLNLNYILLRHDYAAAVRHLVAAYDSGITDNRVKEDVLYRIARIYDRKLSEPALAEKYYREYLRLFPYAKVAPVVSRHLSAIEKAEGGK